MPPSNKTRSNGEVREALRELFRELEATSAKQDQCRNREACWRPDQKSSRVEVLVLGEFQTETPSDDIEGGKQGEPPEIGHPIGKASVL